MAKVTLGALTVDRKPTESVLDCLQSAGAKIPSGCRTGSCQSCMLRLVDGVTPPEAQRGVKDTLRTRGFFLACQARPTVDIVVTTEANAADSYTAQVLSSQLLSADVLQLRLVPTRPFPYFPGQFLNLVQQLNGELLIRSYSIASIPNQDTYLELHLRLVPQGRMTTFAQTLKVGDTVQLRGPSGDCFYVAGRPDQPLLLIGTGTGLAPLYGILREALRSGHQGPITLLHGAQNPSGLYLVSELSALAQQHANLTYVPCVLQSSTLFTSAAPAAAWSAAVPLVEGSLSQQLAARFPKLAGFRVFLCGAPALVQALRRQIFLAGASSREIFADAFAMAPPPGTSA